MIFGSNKKKKEQIGGIQTYLQAEDDVFHRTIIALERLESHLLHGNIKLASRLDQTAVGSSRDLHNSSEQVEDEFYYLELTLQCKSLYMCANYDNPDVFKIAVESFMKNLLEWYGGRNLLEFYDAVDMAIIPLMTAVSHKSNQIDELFDTYVYETPDLGAESVEDKYKATQMGVNSWLKAQHILEHESMHGSQMDETNIITSHFRGTAFDGYRRIIAALSHMCNTSAPLKMIVKLIGDYLPDVASQLPGINEDSIDQMYDQRNNPHRQEEHVSTSIAEPTAEPFDIEFDSENNLSEIQPKAVKSDANSEKVEGQPMKTKDSNLSKEEKYARIHVLANEILDLVKSLEEDK